MKILIAGPPKSGQLEVINKLVGSNLEPVDSVAGLVLDHQVTTKYFTTECGIWADEIDNVREWAAEFSSEEAREVRDAILLFVYTVDSPDPDTEGLEAFVDKLARPGSSLAVAKSGIELSTATKEQLIDLGFDIVKIDEIEPILHSALYDTLANDEDSSASSSVEEDVPVQHRDLEDIMQELKEASKSQSMSNDEKRALAEKLADELMG